VSPEAVDAQADAPGHRDGSAAAVALAARGGGGGVGHLKASHAVRRSIPLAACGGGALRPAAGAAAG